MDRRHVPPTSLIDLLREPASAAGVAEAGWNDVVEQASAAQMLGQLAAAIGRAGCASQVPAGVRRHFDLAVLTSMRRSEAALWEVAAIRRAIDPATAVVVLKGCAYAASGDRNAAGRLFSDIDILVDKTALSRAEGNLIAAGFKPGDVSAYDQRYYREWMHEVPPMEHVRRHTTVDLHHAINPPVSRVHVPTSLLRAAVVEIDDGIFVLSPMDRVVHCALHLVQEGDATKLLRDLYDLYLLLGQHAGSAAALDALWQRAAGLGVLPLVRAAQQAAMAVFSAEGGVQPRGWLARSLVAAAVLPSSHPRQRLAEWALLAHSHWIKMPLPMLVPHLIRKAVVKAPKED